jgi:DNA-binding XRE family transcriptional regulator
MAWSVTPAALGGGGASNTLPVRFRLEAPSHCHLLYTVKTNILFLIEYFWTGQEVSNLKTGRQLQAARVLAGYDREGMSKAAGISSPTLRRLEQQAKISAHTSTVDALEAALAAAGVELLNGDRPGVRLREPLAA